MAGLAAQVLRLHFPDNARLVVHHNIHFGNLFFLAHHWKSSSFLTEGIMLYTIRLITAVTTNTSIPMTAASL